MSKVKQININEEYAISSDDMNIILKRRSRDKKTNEFTNNYINLGYFSNVESLLKRLSGEVVRNTIPEVNTLESLINSVNDRLSKLQEDVSLVVKELRKYFGDKHVRCK